MAGPIRAILTPEMMRPLGDITKHAQYLRGCELPEREIWCPAAARVGQWSPNTRCAAGSGKLVR